MASERTLTVADLGDLIAEGMGGPVLCQDHYDALQELLRRLADAERQNAKKSARIARLEAVERNLIGANYMEIFEWWESQRTRMLVPVMESGGWRMCEYDGDGLRPIGPFCPRLHQAIRAALEAPHD